MNGSRFWIALVSLFFATVLHAQDISGTWQGTLRAEKDMRIVLQVERGGNGGWKAKFYNIDQIDQATDPRPISSFTFQQCNGGICARSGRRIVSGKA